MLSKKVDVVVVGAGISGLCVAHWLNRAGLEVLVLEKDPEVGGTMKSIAEQGFLVETGPNSAQETLLIQELVEDLGLQHEFIYANPVGRNRFILRNGSLHALPLNPLSFLTSKLFSAPAKLRLLKELFIPRAEKEESVAEFAVRRLGQEFLDYAVDPFVAGVYAAKPEELSMRAAFPTVHALEEHYGGLFKGIVKGRGERSDRNKVGGRSFSFLRGMQQLPLAIGKELGARVRCNAKVTSLQGVTRSHPSPPDKNSTRRYRTEFLVNGKSQKVESDKVVFCTPAYVASVLIQPFSSSTAQALSSIHYVPVVSLFLGFKREDVPHPLNGFGFLIPSVEKRKILGCLWSSSIFPNRAPDGMVGFTVLIGGSRQPGLVERDDQHLLQIALEELKSIMQITGKAVYWRVSKWRKAIPLYKLGYGQTLAALRQFEVEHEGIVFCSNYRSGISVGDCVTSAHEVALAIANTMHASTMHRP